MAIKIQFDDMHTPEAPTLVLSKYSGEKLGVIEATSIELSGKFNDASEIHFTVYKEFCHLWDEIRDFRLCWAKEWDKWFQMKVTITDEEATVKNVECRQLGHAELSQVNLHDLQINTEDDIDRDDYNENEPHTFYNERYLENSILYRVMNKVPHYSIKHVDYSVGSLYGVFTFDGVSVLDAFKQLEEEFDCLIVINSGTNDDGTIERSVSVYDLETLCLECGHRGVFTDVCEDCGSTDIKYGYGDDTTIYIDKENLASSVEFTTDNDSVKNCFRLVAGDDLMTDTIIQTNPNGSQYLWFVTDEMKEDMSTELVAKIADYDASYDYYLNDFVMTLPQELVTEYNGLVAKYLSYNEDLISIESNVIGYEKLMDLEYDVIDFELFLQTSFMPSPELMNTTAEQQAALLNRNTMGTVAVANLDTCSKATASNAVMSVAKAIIDPRYSAKIKTDAYDQATRIWTGVITVQNYSNEDDKMDSASLTITINGDEALFVKQQIFRALDKKIDVTKIDSAYDAKALFALDLSDFKNELKTYGVDSLSAFEQMGQSCLDVMQSYGASIDVDWNRAIYDALYIPYSDKVLAIQEELQLREQEVAVINRMHDEVVTNKQTIRSALNMESYFGETLWNEFISFCREDDYRNDNYISDGLSNVELFEFARNFIRTAKKELFKSATLQHSISTTLSNLLVMKEFEPIVDYFQLGNWIRVKCDNEIYKLRLISYTINFDNPENIDVEFSDVKSVATGISDIESIIDQASSMSSSYQSIERQASKGDAASKQMTNWFERGLDATLSKIVNNADDQTMVMDDHGLLMREYNPETDEYNNEQLKIINSTIAITDDNWRSTKTAVGKFYYYDFNTGRLKQTFGINGETVVGKLLVGEALGLYNSSATLKFDENGLYITNGTNTFTVNPNSDVLLAIAKGNDSLLSVNDAGNLTVSGDLVANTLATGGRLSSAVGQSGMYIDSDGNVYSGRANEFMVTYEGKLYAKDADIEGTVKATNGTFSGAISSSTYSAGEKIAKDVKKNGLFIDSDGSIYGGPDNQVTIKPDGTFQFGGTNGVIYNGSTLSVTGNITANTLSTGGRPSASTGHNGLFIDSDGNLYSGSNNGVILYNNGQFNLANKITYNGSIVSIAGDVVIGGSDSASQIIKNITHAQATADSKTHVFYGSPNDTYSGVSIGDYLIDKSDGCTYKWTGTDWDKLTDYSSAITTSINALNESLTTQLDNKIDTWAQMANPSASWTTADDKAKHNGDLWYYTGISNLTVNDVTILPSKTYKYNSSTNKWELIDSPTLRSLFDLTDGKSTIYYGKTTDTYSNLEDGDYLVNDGITYRWDATQSKWVEVTNYSKALTDAINELDEAITAQLDNKIDTWAQSTDPSSSWTTEDKPKHDKDLWYYTGTSIIQVNEVNIEPSKTYQYNATTNKWMSYNNPSKSLFDYVDGKSTIYYGKKTDTFQNVETNDYLVDKSDGCTYRWTGTNWDKLTDYSYAISTAISALNDSLTTQLDNKIDTWVQSTAPSSLWTDADEKSKHNGDLWYYTGTSEITVNEVKIKPSNTYQYNSSTNKWVSYNNPSKSLFDYVDGKSTIYYGKKADHTTGIEEGDYLVDSSDGCTYRWDDTQKKWVEVTNYSKAISDAIEALDESLTTQLDNKIDTWAQMANPSTSWTTADDKAKHNGDLWFYTGISNLTVNGVTILPSKTYKYNSSTNKWELIDQQTAKSLFDLTDGKSSIYYGTTTGTYANLENGDYLVDSTDGCTYRWDATNNTWVEVTKTGTLYATCDTDASTVNKVAQCNKAIALYEGLVVSVKFTKANTSTSALTLKVGDLAAKNIQVGNSNTSSTNKMLWAAGATITFIYNGEKWLFADQPQTYNASCATLADTAAKSSSVSNAVVVNGTTANVTFTYSNTASNATLDITNTSANAASISANGTSLSATSQYNWNAGATASFTFDGTKWLMNNTSALYNTNSYMKFESSGTAQGLMIANMTGGVVGNSSITSRNVLLQSDGLKIRNGQNVLASYGDSIIMYKPGTTTAAVNISSESATFNGIINATAGSFGGFTIDSDSIYSGTKGNSNTNLDITLSTANFQRTIGGVDRSNLKFAIGANFGVKNDGTIYVGDGIFKGSVTATSLSTGGRTSSSTGTNGTYIDSTGNIYIGSTNATKLYANGNFQFGGSNGITYDGSNVTLGSNVKLSWSSITDPHETQLPDWVNKVSTEITGNTIKTTNLYAADIIGDTIHGKNIYTGNKNAKNSTNTGVYLTSDGYITAGAYSSSLGYNPFEVTPSGNLIAKNADITGDITARSLTLIGDASIPYGNISNTPDLDVYIEKDDPLGTVPSDTATSSDTTGFKVSSAGLLTASNARIFGTIYATAGQFKGDVTANTLRTGTKTSSSSGTGTYIDSNGAIYSGAGSTNNFFVDKEGKFTLGGAHGIRYVSNNNGNYIYIGDGLSIQLSNGNMAIDSGDHLVFNDGLVAYGNIIAGNHSGSGGTMRATGGLFVGTGVDSYVFHANDDGTVYCSNKLTCGSVSTTGSISGNSLNINNKASISSTGVITGTSLSAGSGSISGNSLNINNNKASISSTGVISGASLSVTGNLSCGSFTPSSLTAPGEIKSYSSSASTRYARIYYGASESYTEGVSLSDMAVVESRYKTSRADYYARLTTGYNVVRIDAYYNSSNYVYINGKDGSITATGNVKAAEFDGSVLCTNGSYRKPIGTTSTNKYKVDYIEGASGSKISVTAQYGSSTWTSHNFISDDSDERMKHDISDTNLCGIDIVKAIRHRQFVWNDSNRHDEIGYIAQELNRINPSLVVAPEFDNGMYCVNTLSLLAVSTKAVQELIAEVDTLKSRIAELERTKGEINES